MRVFTVCLINVQSPFVCCSSLKLNSFLGLHGKNNLDRARCDGIVDVLKEIRVEMRPVTPYFLKETDEAKIVCSHDFSLIEERERIRSGLIPNWSG